MNNFEFKRIQEKNIYVYSYVSDPASLFKKSWKGLFDNTVSTIIGHADLSNSRTTDYEKIVEAKEPEYGFRLTKETPFNQFCINNVNREEVAIYLGFIWRLIKGLNRFAIPSYYLEVANELVGKSHETKWEYVVHNEDDFRDIGFERAKSWSSESQRVIHKGGLFKVESFKDLVLLQNSVQRDASSNLNLFCFKSTSGFDELLKKLNQQTAPNMDEILNQKDIFINLTVGSDPGYLDSILIKSKENLENEIDNIVKEYQKNIEQYESKVSDIETLEQFILSIQKLIKIN